MRLDYPSANYDSSDNRQEEVTGFHDYLSMDGPGLATRYRDRSNLDPRLALRESLIHGKGLIATQPFRVDEVVIVFGGALFTKEDIVAGKANNRTQPLDYRRPDIDGSEEDLSQRRGDHGLRDTLR